MSDRPDLADRSVHRVVDSDDVTVVDDLRMCETLLAAACHFEGHVGAGFESRQPVSEILGSERLAEKVLPGLRIAGVGEHRLVTEAWIVEGPSEASQLREGPALVGQHRGGLDKAPVFGGDENPVAAGLGARPRVDRRLLAALGEELHDCRDEVLDGFDPRQQVGVYPLPTSGAIPD